MEANRTNTARADTSAACLRAKAGVTIRSVTGSAQAGARATPTTVTRANPAVGLPEPLGEPGDLLGEQQAQDHLVADVQVQVRGSRLADEDLVRRVVAGSPAGHDDGLGEARRVAGAAAERDEPDRRGVDLAIQATGVQLAVTPGMLGTWSKTVSCAAGSRTCASARPVAAASRS